MWGKLMVMVGIVGGDVSLCVCVCVCELGCVRLTEVGVCEHGVRV